MATIISDIDGTLLSSGTHPMQKTIDWLNAQSGYKIALVTGRPVSQRSATVEALKNAGVKYDSLTLNPGSTADTAAYKEMTAKSMPDVAMAMDNNPDMRAAYKRAGVPKVIDPKDCMMTTMNKGFWSVS